MTFTTAIRTCLSKYATFSGRASRPEFWWFVLFYFLVGAAIDVLDALFFGYVGFLNTLFDLAMFLPLTAAGWRRLQDSSRPGWMILIPLLVIALSMAVVVTGIWGYFAMEEQGTYSEVLNEFAGPLAMGGLIALGIVQFGTLAMMVWWLTRPGDAGPNASGPPPV